MTQCDKEGFPLPATSKNMNQCNREGFPPCCFENHGTHGPNPHGFWYPCNLRVPIPTPIKTCTCEHRYRFQAGVGVGTHRVTHGLPVTGPKFKEGDKEAKIQEFLK